MTHEQMQTASSANEQSPRFRHEQVEAQCPSTHLHHTPPPLPAQPPLPPAPPLRGKKNKLQQLQMNMSGALNYQKLFTVPGQNGNLPSACSLETW